MKNFKQEVFNRILAIPFENLDHDVATLVMGGKSFAASPQAPAYYELTGERLDGDVWLLTGEMHNNGTETLPFVTVFPSYSKSLNCSFMAQAKVYGAAYQEALSLFIGYRLGASENTFYQIAQGQLLGRVTAGDICRAALYVALAGYGVETYTGDTSLSHVQELLNYSQQPYQVLPTADVAAGIAEQCLNLEFEELYEKAQALGKEGYFQDLVFNKLQASNCVAAVRDNEDGTPKISFVPDDNTNQVDLVALLDACVDQRVVADGTILKYGLGHIFHQAFMLVHENNLTKFPTDEDVAKASALHYTIGNGILAEYVWNQRWADKGNYVIRRKADGKFLKPLGWQEPDLGPLVANELVTHLAK